MSAILACAGVQVGVAGTLGIRNCRPVLPCVHGTATAGSFSASPTSLGSATPRARTVSQPHGSAGARRRIGAALGSFKLQRKSEK